MNFKLTNFVSVVLLTNICLLTVNSYAIDNVTNVWQYNDNNTNSFNNIADINFSQNCYQELKDSNASKHKPNAADDTGIGNNDPNSKKSYYASRNTNSGRQQGNMSKGGNDDDCDFSNGRNNSSTNVSSSSSSDNNSNVMIDCPALQELSNSVDSTRANIKINNNHDNNNTSPELEPANFKQKPEQKYANTTANSEPNKQDANINTTSNNNVNTTQSADNIPNDLNNNNSTSKCVYKNICEERRPDENISDANSNNELLHQEKYKDSSNTQQHNNDSKSNNKTELTNKRYDNNEQDSSGNKTTSRDSDDKSPINNNKSKINNAENNRKTRQQQKSIMTNSDNKSVTNFIKERINYCIIQIKNTINNQHEKVKKLINEFINSIELNLYNINELKKQYSIILASCLQIPEDTSNLLKQLMQLLEAKNTMIAKQAERWTQMILNSKTYTTSTEALGDHYLSLIPLNKYNDKYAVIEKYS